MAIEYTTRIGTDAAYAEFEKQQAAALEQDWRATIGQQFVPLPVTDAITQALASIKPATINEAKLMYEQMRDRGDPAAWIANRLLQEFPKEALISLGVPLLASTPTPTPTLTPTAPPPVTPQPTPAPAPVTTPLASLTPTAPAAGGLTKVATSSIGPDGKPIYDLFRDGQHLTEYPAGVNIQDIPEGQAPAGFKSQFQPPAAQPAPLATPQPAAQPAQPAQPTTPVAPAPENIPLSQSGQYYKTGNDVFETGTNAPIDLTTFQELGLNFQFIPEKSDLIKTIVDQAAARGEKYPAETIGRLFGEEAKTEEEIRNELYTKYGISGLEEKFKTRPTQTFEEIYQKIYDQSGLVQMKVDMDKLRTKIEEADEDYVKASGVINRNPWISESGRVGKMAKLTDSYNKTKTNLNSQMTLLDNQYSRGKQDAENVATRTLTAFDKQRQYDKEELNYYIARAEADTEARLKTQETETEERKFKYYPEYAAGFQERTKTYEPPTSYQEWVLAGQPGTYESWLAKKGKPKAPTSSTGANYNTRLNAEISNVYTGRYGKQGAREQAINILRNEFPNIDVSKDIYNRLPDGYEKSITTTQDIGTLLQIQEKLSDPDISSEELMELYNQL